jgi:hypothetical protein
VPAHLEAQKEAEPNGATHQGGPKPLLLNYVTHAWNKPGCYSNEPGIAGRWLSFVDLHSFSFNQASLSPDFTLNFNRRQGDF